MAGKYDGGQSPVDSSGWRRPVSNQKGGETHPAPAETRVDRDTGTSERVVSPEPDPSAIRRNFSRNSR